MRLSTIIIGAILGIFIYSQFQPRSTAPPRPERESYNGLEEVYTAEASAKVEPRMVYLKIGEVDYEIAPVTATFRKSGELSRLAVQSPVREENWIEFSFSWHESERERGMQSPITVDWTEHNKAKADLDVFNTFHFAGSSYKAYKVNFFLHKLTTTELDMTVRGEFLKFPDGEKAKAGEVVRVSGRFTLPLSR